MNLSQLASFAEVATTGSFTEAALARDISQSAISHAIQSLEQELGVTLLVRSRKGVAAITPVGERVLEHALAMLTHADDITQEALAAQGTGSGKLRVGSIRSFVSPRLLAGFVSNFRRAHPDVEFVLFEGTMKEVAMWIDARTIDVGFVILPAEGIDGIRVSIDELVVVMPEDHPLRSSDHVTPELILAEDLVMENTDCVLHVLQRTGLGSAARRPRIRYQASNTETILAMVREGVALSLIPRRMLPEGSPGLVTRPFEVPQPIELGLAVRSQSTPSWAARQFIEAATTWAWQAVPNSMSSSAPENDSNHVGSHR